MDTQTGGHVTAQAEAEELHLQTQERPGWLATTGSYKRRQGPTPTGFRGSMTFQPPQLCDKVFLLF